MSHLILTDSKELGDRRLNPEENLLRLKEENAKLTQQYKFESEAVQKQLEDVDQALGSPMPYQELIRRLMLLEAGLIFEESTVLNSIALRVLVNTPDGVQKKYVGGFKKEVMPEFSYLVPDERGLPKREVRGWRTVLLMLLHAKVVTLAQVTKVFGEPVGARSWRWYQQTRSLR